MDDTDLSCIWNEWINSTGGQVPLCHHPLMNGFCDYCDVTEDTFDEKQCPYYQPVEPGPSLIEEEVRQYLEYTEPQPKVHLPGVEQWLK